MNTTSWPQVRRILEAAIDCPAHRRERLLDRACRGNAELRRQVCDLLAHEKPGDEWLAPPIPGAAAQLLELSQIIGCAGRLGRYRIGQVLAVGGMGVVLEGVDESENPPRTVAIKMLPPGLCTRRTMRAFRREQRLLQQLDHPNITRMFDSGLSSDGQPYIVMEFVDGRPIDEYFRTNGLAIEERLELFRSVCLAVHYAHQNLIVHRDLKPGNILVGDGGVVKLLDFGIAKLLEQSPQASAARTETMMDAMTLQYSSPEQIRGESITTATDVYSLGVVLFELLAGCAPYNLAQRSRYEAEKTICESSLSTPREAARALPQHERLTWGPALDRIVMKAMHREPARRYASAEQLAEDIRRYLEGSTVMAYKAGRIERAVSVVRKHRLAFGGAAASFIVVIALAVILAITAHNATVSRDREVRARLVSQKINGIMNELLATAGPARIGASYAGLHVLREASVLADRDLGDQPDIAAGLHMQIAATYYNIRRDSEAIREYRIALAGLRRCATPNMDRLAECMSSLGAVLSYQDEPEGLLLQQEALSLRRTLHGERDLRVAESLHGVAFALTRCARPPRYQEAEGLYRKALEMRCELGAAESAVTAMNLHALAALMRHQDRLEEAADQYAKALALCRRTVDPLDGQLVDCINDYSICLRDLHRYSEAESLLKESLVLTTQSLGELSAACTLTDLACVIRARGDRGAGWRMIHRALGRLCHVMAASATGDREVRWRRLSDIFDRQPNRCQPEAYREFIAMAPVSNTAGGVPANIYCCVLDRLASFAAGDGEFDLAIAISRDVIQNQEAHDPGSRLTHARYQVTLAESLAGRNQMAEARELLSEAHRTFCDTRGREYRETRAIAAKRSRLGSENPVH